MADATVALQSFLSYGDSGKGISVPVKASETIEPGTLTITTSGFLVDGGDVASSEFGGVCAESSIITGGSSDGDVSCRVRRRGRYAFAMTGGSANTDLGKEVEIVDNQTVGLAGDTTNHVKCGRIVGWCAAAAPHALLAAWVSGAFCVVDITGY